MDDFRRLSPIFQQPASIVALESFNQIIHSPSETMITTLLELFNNALLQDTPSNLLHQDPLFIVVLINRIISHSSSSSPSQPSRAKLSTTFQDFLPIFLHLEFKCPFHAELFKRIKKQLTICMTKLAVRLISSYSSNLDPMAEIINSLRHLIEHPHLEATSACLEVIKDVLTFFDRANAVDADSLNGKITRNHFEGLYEVYNRLVAASLSLAHDTKNYNQYRKIFKSINLLLKIFKTMVEPLTTLSSASSPPILDCLSRSLLTDFQTCMDSELNQMNRWKTETDNHTIVNTIVNTSENSNHLFIHEFNTFNSHICLYGDILLRIQSCQASIITPEVLQVYLKIVEHVSTELVSIHNNTNNPPNQVPIIDNTNLNKLNKFYPLLNQALKLLNNSLNAWNSYDDVFNEINSKHQIQSKLSNNLNREEVLRLTEILQPLLTYRFGLQSYLDGETQPQISDDSDEDSSDENTEDSMEVEEEEEEDASVWENQSTSEEEEENDQIINNDIETEENEQYISTTGTTQEYVQTISPPQVFIAPSEVFNEKMGNLGHPNLSYSVFNNTSSNQNLTLVHKEPLQIEIEDLIKNLNLIDQSKNF